MRIGLVARADKSGLAVQTFEFWKNVKPSKTLVVNPTWIGAPRGTDLSKYPGAMVVDSHPYPKGAMEPNGVIDEFLHDLDVVFTCETPYNFWLFKRAKELGVKTVLQFNYEFLYLFQSPHLPAPDMLAAPSLWNFNQVHDKLNSVGIKPSIEFLPVPVNRTALPYRQRTELRSILHTAGNPAIHDRNGTLLLMEAMSLLPASIPVTLTVHSQQRLDSLDSTGRSNRIEIRTHTVDNYTDLYNDEDIYIMPRKFGGLSLPVNEAAACGMPVIMTDLSPQNSFLPPEALLPCHHATSFNAATAINVYETNPIDITKKIIELYENPDLVGQLSDASNAHADSISWENMLPKYMQTFEELCS